MVIMESYLSPVSTINSSHGAFAYIYNHVHQVNLHDPLEIRWLFIVTRQQITTHKFQTHQKN